MKVQRAFMEDSPAPPQQLGKYQLVATLGQGGMGTVYLALASGLGQFRKLVVVKELRQDLTRQQGFVSMFMDEARLAARLSHPNVVQTFEASEEDDRYFLAMEYLDGQSMSALLERLSQTPLTRVPLSMHIQILCEALSGLHYAHELQDYDGTSLQVVHRDVSPQNVFVTYHGQVKVVDFGVAKVANATATTTPGVFMGRFSYAAPEQVLGRPVDARTDLFAVGVMLWQAIAGRPFSGESPTPAACIARTEGKEPRIEEVVPIVDPVLARICDRALAVDPEQRFDSALEFRNELQDYLQRSGVRVDAPEISRLMHEVFDAERRALHAHIDQATRRTDAGPPALDALTIYQRVDKERTAVADLSSLVGVSLERDEQKIRQGYAHSKITLVRSPGEQAPAILKTGAGPAPRRNWLGITAVTLVGLLCGALAMLERRSADSIETSQRAASAALSAMAPRRDALLDERDMPHLAATVTGSSATDTASVGVSAIGSDLPIVLQPLPSTPKRLRNRSRQGLHAAHESADSSPALEAEPATPTRAVEQGADVLSTRRASGLRIDHENPYR